VLDVMDQTGGNLFLVLGGLLLAIFVGYRMEDPIGEAGRGERAALLRVWRMLLRTVVPAVLIVVLASSAWDTWNKIAGLLG